MDNKFNVALIGLDTSHAIEFARRIQGSDYPDNRRVSGLSASHCLRFATHFQDDAGLDVRQKLLESWGIKVTSDFSEAVTVCDGLMLTINEPALHLPYLKRCLELKKPIFLDKPLADTLENGREMVKLAIAAKVPFFCSSALRCDPAVEAAARLMPSPAAVTVWGPLGTAPFGSSVLWYGVHAFEMLQRLMGCGAATVQVIKDMRGMVVHVGYCDGRRGVVELTADAYRYGGVLRDHRSPEVHFSVQDSTIFYDCLMTKVAGFFLTGQSPLPVDDMLEVMGMLDAAERSEHSGQRESL